MKPLTEAKPINVVTCSGNKVLLDVLKQQWLIRKLELMLYKVCTCLWAGQITAGCVMQFGVDMDRHESWSACRPPDEGRRYSSWPDKRSIRPGCCPVFCPENVPGDKRASAARAEREERQVSNISISSGETSEGSSLQNKRETDVFSESRWGRVVWYELLWDRYLSGTKLIMGK